MKNNKKDILNRLSYTHPALLGMFGGSLLIISPLFDNKDDSKQVLFLALLLLVYGSAGTAISLMKLRKEAERMPQDQKKQRQEFIAKFNMKQK